MQKRRNKVAAACCNGYLYAIGGHESSTLNKSLVRHDDGERFDPKSNQWTLITSFSRPKENLGICAVNTNIYIVGGFDEKILNEMESYDIETNKWRKCPSLSSKRTGAHLIHVPNQIDRNLSQENQHSSTVNRFILAEYLLFN